MTLIDNKRFCGIRLRDELLKPLVEHQRDVEDSFKLDCSFEDVKTDKEAYKLYKKLKKQRKYVDKIIKITNKHIIN